MKLIRKLTAVYVILVFTLVFSAVFIHASVNKNTPSVTDNSHSENVTYEVVFNAGPPIGIFQSADISTDDIDPINMFQTVQDGKLIKVILGTIKNNAEKYAFSILSSDKNGSNSTKQITHPLNYDMGNNVRIIGVGTGEDFFLQNEKGNEYIYHIDWSSSNKQVTLLRSCTKRCE